MTVGRLFSTGALGVTDTMRAISFSGPVSTAASGTLTGYSYSATSNATGTTSATLIGYRHRMSTFGFNSIRTAGGIVSVIDENAFLQPYTQSAGLVFGHIAQNFFMPQSAGNFTFAGGMVGGQALAATGTGSAFFGFISTPFVIGHQALPASVPSGGGMTLLLAQGGGGYDTPAHTYTHSPMNWGYRYTEQTGGVKNAGLWGNTDAATPGAGWCTGTAADTCTFRGRAGAWEDPNATDRYTLGFHCAGPGCTSSAPVASAVGVYDSAVRVCSSASSTGPGSVSLVNGALTVNFPAAPAAPNSIAITGTFNRDDSTSLTSRTNGNGSPTSPLTATLCASPNSATIAGNGRLRGSVLITFCLGDVAAGSNVLFTITGFSGLNSSHVVEAGISEPRAAAVSNFITGSPFILTPSIQIDTQVITIVMRAALAFTTTGSTQAMVWFRAEYWPS